MLAAFVAIVAFLVVVVVICVPHEIGHAIMARLCGVWVQELSMGFGKKICSWKFGTMLCSLRVFPLGAFVRMADEGDVCPTNLAAFRSKGPLARLLIMVAGPITNVVFAGVIFVAIFVIGVPELVAKVGAVAANSPAELAGLRLGDEIVEINRTKVAWWEDVGERINERVTAGDSCVMIVRREGQTCEVSLVPQKQEVQDLLGDKRTRYVIGILPADQIAMHRRGFFRAIEAAFIEVWAGLELNVRALKKLVTGELAPSKAMGGPIAFVQLSGQAVSFGWLGFLRFIAIISLVLGVVNLLPIPVLDGGNALLTIVEGIRGKPFSPSVEQKMQYVGLMALILLGVYATYLDIWRLIFQG